MSNTRLKMHPKVHVAALCHVLEGKPKKKTQSKPIKTPFLIRQECGGDPVGNDGNYGN